MEVSMMDGTTFDTGSGGTTFGATQTISGTQPITIGGTATIVAAACCRQTIVQVH
jgi:hypothetical protein